MDPAKEGNEIRCRVAACPEAVGDDNEWSFYLLNDSCMPLDEVVLTTFGHEWGDFGDAGHPDMKLVNVRPGESVLIWRGNDEELRM